MTPRPKDVDARRKRLPRSLAHHATSATQIVRTDVTGGLAGGNAVIPAYLLARQSSHWFALTDGWYWIDVQGHELLRYRDGAVRRWDLERPHPDYFVGCAQDEARACASGARTRCPRGVSDGH
ncbi:hypothetical protein Cch01nite_42200 [Cellulomonas chitinilytica]|uniref:Uncharacterized protein n=1 Tax=Cellulomonas chitinilytica TaxID=398759 RepID=A0A919U3P1_9CELL|nr:DUF5984 family protein [Cellulomonas chitinilytica]GIG23496.1 hypothetical protein Cch01nite_42200 [Cellulomonas chitinilytica]